MANPASLLNVLNGTETSQPLLLGAGTKVGGTSIGPGTKMVVATATLAVTQALHEGKTILLSLLASFTSTLPAATGTGNMYRFMNGIVTTSGGGYVIATDGTAVFKGSLLLTKVGTTFDNAGAAEAFATTTLKNITLNATTTGGLTIGDWVQVQDIAANVWAVTGLLTGSGSLVTPFS